MCWLFVILISVYLIEVDDIYEQAIFTLSGEPSTTSNLDIYNCPFLLII